MTMTDVEERQPVTNADGPRENLRKAIWEITQWRAGAALIDQILNAADRYADERCREIGHILSARYELGMAVTVEPGFTGTQLNDAENTTDLTGANSRTWELADGSTITRTWPDEKSCRKCEKTKPIDEFNFTRDNGDGHAIYCRLCAADIRRKNLTGKE